MIEIVSGSHFLVDQSRNSQYFESSMLQVAAIPTRLLSVVITGCWILRCAGTLSTHRVLLTSNIVFAGTLRFPGAALAALEKRLLHLLSAEFFV